MKILTGWTLLVYLLLLPFGLNAQTLSEIAAIACQNQGPECQQNIVTEDELNNPADAGTLKLVSAGASLLYMGGVLNGVVKLPAFMGDVAKICVSSGLMVATNLLAFMNAQGNGKKIEAELKAIKDEADRLQARINNSDERQGIEFQIEIFDFYMMAMQRLQKVTQLRMKQHGQNSSYYSTAMAAGTAEAIIYSLPTNSNPPMAKCGAMSAVFAGIALALEKKAQGQAQNLLDAYIKRWQILAEIKARLLQGTITEVAVAPGITGPDRGTDIGLAPSITSSGLSGARDWESEIGGLSVTGSEYGCINNQMSVDQACTCAATDSCYKTTVEGWDQERYSSAFTAVALDNYIANLNGAFSGNNTNPASLSMAAINQQNAIAARVRDRILADYREKEEKVSEQYRLKDKIGVANNRELAAFLNENFTPQQVEELFTGQKNIFAGNEQVDLGASEPSLLAQEKLFEQKVEAPIPDTMPPALKTSAINALDFGLNQPDEYELIDINRDVILKDENYDYVGKREDIVRNNEASLFEIISHRYQLIYRQKPADL